jgi:uncharacterized short protein YbdD (DUF466 family)
VNAVAVPVVAAWRACWRALRTLSGDDAYERYLRHHAAAHPDCPVLSRRQFFVDEQQRKWGTINRCC